MSKGQFFSDIKDSLFKGRFSQSQVDGTKVLLAATEGLTLEHRAYILATAYHETAHTMQPIHERGGRHYFDKYDGRLGNNKKGEGWLYRGRGYVQLTGKRNYKLAKSKLGVDFVKYPDKALEPLFSSEIIVKGMEEGWFTGRKLNNYKTYKGMRRVVNGTDRASLIAGYADSYESALGLLDTPEEALTPLVTGKKVHKSTTNMAAAAAGVSMVASASGDARNIISNLGIDPKWLLLVVGLAAVAWIFRERIKKSYVEGV